MTAAEFFWGFIGVLTLVGAVGLVAAAVAMAKSGYSEH